MAHSTPQGILDDVAMVSFPLRLERLVTSVRLLAADGALWRRCAPPPLASGFCSVFQVLDEEAEVFIVKMWRLLIYETEAKKIGLVK